MIIVLRKKIEDSDGIADGEDETWYMLYNISKESNNHLYTHISENVTTIKYWFKNFAPNDSTYTWTSEPGITEEIAQEIKTAYINSMLKWNDVYYYSYDENGYRVAKKVIHIEEALTEEDSNLKIYPIEDESSLGDLVLDFFACTGPDGNPIKSDNNQNNIHFHYNNWHMYVNLHYFYSNDDVSETQMNVVRERTGEHELGHVLGLKDVDLLCSASSQGYHHEEILMGYGNVFYRQKDVMYKDIAGVAINRGFHDDDDHKWMRRDNDDETIDLICSICNGVLFDVELDSNGRTYQGEALNDYKSCIHYGGTNSDMLLVATDGKRDFFKCQYCRHIDTVKVAKNLSSIGCDSIISGSCSIVEDTEIYIKFNIMEFELYHFNFSATHAFNVLLYDSNFNKVYVNMISENSDKTKMFTEILSPGTYYIKLNHMYNNFYTSMSFTIAHHTHSYTYQQTEIENGHIARCECGYEIIQSHVYSGHICVHCGEGSSIHDYDRNFVWMDFISHSAECECGEVSTLPHVVSSNSFGSGNRYSICLLCGGRVQNGFIQINSISINKVSDNGSFILPDGVIVLVDEDLDAFFNGTLVFYKKNETTVTQ